MTKERRRFNALLKKRVFHDMTDEEIEVVLADPEGFVVRQREGLQGWRSEQGGEPDEKDPRKSHADIRIELMIGGEDITFVGFIREGNDGGYVLGDTMLERVRAVGFEPVDDNGLLDNNREEWADDPELAEYYVVTNVRFPDRSRVVQYFHRGGRELGWYPLGGRFSRDVLVACRARKLYQ